MDKCPKCVQFQVATPADPSIKNINLYIYRAFRLQMLLLSKPTPVMKQFFIFISFVFLHETCSAQSLIISGKIKNHDSPDSIELNIPLYGSAYYRENSVFKKIDADGRFYFSVKIAKQKFALLRYQGKEQWLLLSPGRPLTITIDTNTAQWLSYSGKAKTENELLRDLLPSEGLYFYRHIDHSRGSNPYMKWSMDSIVNVLFPMVKHSRDSSTALIGGAMELPFNLQIALHSEVKYRYARELGDLVINAWRFYHNTNLHLIFDQFADAYYAMFHLPLEAEFLASPCAFDFTTGYWGTLHLKAIDGWYGDDGFQKIMGYPLKEERRLDSVYGSGYAGIVNAKYVLPAFAYEPWLTTSLEFYQDIKDLKMSEQLLKELAKDFPKNIYLRRFALQLNIIRESKQRFAKNPAIRFRQDDNVISSIKDLVSPYKGKVVFLDFWGTWCGSCLAELKTATPSLREKFKDKDVIFLYVARDEDSENEKWRNDVFIYNMQGEHVRLDRKRIQILRDALDTGLQTNLYPTYYIFDREGNPIIKNSKRPSDEPALYKQLDSVLNIINRVYSGDWEENIGYEDIHIRRDYHSVSSLANLLAPYKGKNVYLDVWGTWCGPCREEMKYTPALKEKFKDKDVVFLYVDKDENDADSTWRNFINNNHLTGEHVRITQEWISNLWNDLGSNGQVYPTYFIFDKRGRLAVKNAKRPSDGQILYNQLNEALNK